MTDEMTLLPEPDHETAPFWEATKAGHLALQRCASCKTFRHPPAGVCSNCQSEESEWAELSGRGTIYSYIEVHQPVLPSFRTKAPYTVVNVAPDEAPGVRVMGNMEGAEYKDLKVGQKVQVVFDEIEDVAIPRWKLV